MQKVSNVLFILGTVLILIAYLSRGLWQNVRKNRIDGMEVNPNDYELPQQERERYVRGWLTIFKSPLLWTGVLCWIISILISFF